MINHSPTGKSVISNFIWKFAERCGAQAVTFIITIILARLLTTDEYGLVATVTIIISFLNIFVDSGLSASLIQKKDADDTDFSTVFYFNICFCLLLYTVLFFTAPFIADAYAKAQDQLTLTEQFSLKELLTSLIRVLGLTLVLSGIKNVQHAYVSKTMQFRLFFFASLIGTVIAAAVGIIMAYNGCGVWSIVAQHLTDVFIDTIVLWFTARWRPKRLFSFHRLLLSLKYGWKLLVASLLSTLSNDIRQMIISYKYSPSNLSFYNKGSQFPTLITDNINTAIDSVLFPAMSSVQTDQQSIREMTRKSIRFSSYLMLPFLVGMAVCAEPIVRLLLTEKFLPCVPYLQIFCFISIFKPIHTSNLNAIKALGRSDIFLKLDICKKIVDVILLIITVHFGPLAIAIGLVISNLIAQIINTYPNRKLLNYTYIQQIQDILPFIGLAAVMGVCVYAVNFIALSNFLTLVIQVLLGAIIYIGGSKILQFDTFNYLASLLAKLFSSGKQATK